MNIAEKQKQQLIDLNDSRVNEILGFELEVGKWYKYKGFGELMFYFNGEFSKSGYNPNYGFDYNGFFQKEIGVHKREVNEYYEATKQEIEQALTNEAKRRGFEKVGDLSITFVDGRNFKKGYFNTYDNKFNFCKEYNTLLIDGVEIFNNGQWAEIIDEKAELKEEIKELRKKLKSLEEKL